MPSTGQGYDRFARSGTTLRGPIGRSSFARLGSRRSTNDSPSALPPPPQHDETQPPITHPDDVALLRAAARGDRAARLQFGERLACVPAILRALDRRHGRPLRGDELDDVVQEVAAAVWRKIETYRGIGSLESWLYQFCSLELLRFLDRRHRRRQRVQLSETLDEHWQELPEPDPLRFDHVYRRLGQLAAAEQDVLRARFFEHRTLEQTAERLGIPTNTVKTRYYRGLERLASLLRMDEEGRA